jgi:hypothetical protein
MLAIPTNAAADTQAASSLAGAKQVLKEKVHDALSELAEMRVEVITPIRATDDEDGGDTSAENGGSTA